MAGAVDVSRRGGKQGPAPGRGGKGPSEADSLGLPFPGAEELFGPVELPESDQGFRGVGVDAEDVGFENPSLVIERWSIVDMLGLLVQLGATPAPA